MPSSIVRVLLATTALVSLTLVAPSSAEARTHRMTIKQAAAYYLKIVRPYNNEVDEWDRLAEGKHTLNVFTREAGYVAHENAVWLRKMIKADWPRKADNAIRQLEIVALRQEESWLDMATARSFGQLRRAYRGLPASRRQANAVRRVLGLPAAT